MPAAFVPVLYTARASRSKIHVCVVDDRLHAGLVNIGVQHLSICLQTAAKKTFDGQCMLNDQPNIQVAIRIEFPCLSSVASTTNGSCHRHSSYSSVFCSQKHTYILLLLVESDLTHGTA